MIPVGMSHPVRTHGEVVPTWRCRHEGRESLNAHLRRATVVIITSSSRCDTRRFKMRRNLTLKIAPNLKASIMLWKTNAPTTASSSRQVFHCVCDPTPPTGERMASRRRELSCPRMRTVGEGVGGRWISLLYLLMCVATGEVLASASPNSGGSTRGRTGGTSAGAWPSDVRSVCLPHPLFAQMR